MEEGQESCAEGLGLWHAALFNLLLRIYFTRKTAGGLYSLLPSPKSQQAASGYPKGNKEYLKIKDLKLCYLLLIFYRHLDFFILFLSFLFKTFDFIEGQSQVVYLQNCFV